MTKPVTAWLDVNDVVGHARSHAEEGGMGVALQTKDAQTAMTASEARRQENVNLDPGLLVENPLE